MTTLRSLTLKDPSLVGDDEIVKTTEYKSFMSSGSTWKTVLTKEAALLTCRLIMRAMRRKEKVPWPTVARSFAHKAISQIEVTNMAMSMINSKVKMLWAPSGRDNDNHFTRAARSLHGTAKMSLGPGTVLNCWEFILVAAIHAERYSWKEVRELYKMNDPTWTPPKHMDWYGFVKERLEIHGPTTYDFTAKGAKPLKGDMVFFDGLAHVVVATGATTSKGAQVISFWPAPYLAFGTGLPIEVTLTTIEEIKAWWDNYASKANPHKKKGLWLKLVEFSTAPWNEVKKAKAARKKAG